jgi:hypothetical protein
MQLRNCGPAPSVRPAPMTTITTKVSSAVTLVVLACCLLTTPAHAQGGSLPLGTINVLQAPVVCSSSYFSYTNTSTNTTYYLNCYVATVTCPNTASLNMTFGYLSPVGVVPGVTQAFGVIVIVSGGRGLGPDAEENNYAKDYFAAGYEIVEFGWADDWEKISDPIPKGTYGNIQNAACRPATFLNYVYSNIFPSVLQSNSRAGMCEHATSAGSAAAVYSLAYYGAGSYLDNVELISGPVLSDIEQGCQVPPPSNVTVCGQTNYNGGQYGCQLGTGLTWNLAPTYVDGQVSLAAGWTNDPSCANGIGQTTTPQSQAQWLKQSIVDQYATTGQGANPTFNYASTGMSGWLCRSVVNNSGYDCAANGNNNSQYCPNNSSTQGQIFYANIGQSNSPAHYDVYAVDSCISAEGVADGTVTGFYPAVFGPPNYISGKHAVTYDMIGYAPNIPAQCVHRPH